MTSIIPSILPSIFPSIEGSILSAFGAPSLMLDFARNAYSMGAIGSVPSDRTFASLVTFSRSSGGGRINAAGEFEWVGNDVPRLTYDPVTLQPLGLLIEEQRTNLLTRSSNVADVAWIKAACTTSPAGSSPGGLPAEKITPVAGAGNHYYTQAAAFAGAVDNGVFSLTLRIKADGYNHFHIQGKTKSDLYPAANVDLAAGTITLLNASGSATASIEPLSGGWYLCSLSWSVLTGAQLPALFLTPKPTAMNSVSFTADGVSGALVSGHQLEPASVKSSHIPTEASQVTRAADVCSVNTLSPWYNETEGALVAGFVSVSEATAMAASLNNSTSGAIALRAKRGAAALGYPTGLRSLGGAQAAMTAGTSVSTGFEKVAISYGAGKAEFARNGVSSGIQDADAPIATRLSTGVSNGLNTEWLNGTIASLEYYPRVIDVQQAST